MNIGILGYGNLGRAIEELIENEMDIGKVRVFSRRAVKARYASIHKREELFKFKDEIDCLFICGGSSGEGLENIKEYSGHFNTVDCFDTHANAYKYLQIADRNAKRGDKVSLCFCGWDPGVLSLLRGYFCALRPHSVENTFWGKGVSQGHSEAIRTLDGVKYAIQYTVPIDEAIKTAKRGIKLFDTERHKRVCYVVSDKKNQGEIEKKIKEMPFYFEGYDTEVNFISEEEYFKEHNVIDHKGRVICRDKEATLDFSLSIKSNPHFTAGVMLAYSKALARLLKEKKYGAYTPLDIPISYILKEEQIKFI